VAAAVWYPYRAYPQELVLGWSKRTFEVFEELARQPGSGVAMSEAVELWPRAAPDPWWAGAVPWVRHLPADELPDGYTDALHFPAPIAVMPVYLEYLLRRFTNRRGRVRIEAVASLAQLAQESVVVNCSGLGARDLCDDASLVPIRGQVVRVTNAGLHRFLLVEQEGVADTYIVPRGEDCILGGTAEVGNWETTPDPATAAGILERCCALEPRLRAARVLDHRVGLRPGRPSVRLEIEHVWPSATVVHNYGHGGAGMTLSWGCAEEVARLIQDAL
jgi:D-amino-acid oxidase